MKKILFTLLSVFTIQAYAVTMTNSGSIGGACTISNVANGVLASGTMSVPGDAIGTPASGGYPAQATISQNQANAFKLVIVEGTISAPSVSNPVKNLYPSISDGPNAGVTFSGSVTSTTREANLAAAGQDTFLLNSSFSTAGTPLPIGNYSMSYDVTCVAQ